jgi:hypothetical protein
MKSTTLLSLTLATATFAFGQTGNTNSIESQLEQLRLEKARIVYAFDQMSSFHPAQITWESHLERLAVVKESVNRSGSIIRSLDAQRAQMSAAQQVRLDEVKSQTALVAGSTNNLLLQIQNNRLATRTPAYGDSVKQAYLQASGASQAVRALIASTTTTTSTPSGN